MVATSEYLQALLSFSIYTISITYSSTSAPRPHHSPVPFQMHRPTTIRIGTTTETPTHIPPVRRTQAFENSLSVSHSYCPATHSSVIPHKNTPVQMHMARQKARHSAMEGRGVLGSAFWWDCASMSIAVTGLAVMVEGATTFAGGTRVGSGQALGTASWYALCILRDDGVVFWFAEGRDGCWRFERWMNEL